MSDFISQELQKQNTPPETYKSKVKLNKNDVHLGFRENRDTGGTFKLYYNVQIITRGRKVDPKKKLTPATIDMESLREAILSSIGKYDRKYLVLKKFDDRKAVFELDHEKYLKDATRSLRPTIKYSKFNREFKFKQAPPKEVLRNAIPSTYGDFITRKFMDWLEDNKTKQKKWFKYLIPKSQQSRIRTKFRNMFDWSYDQQKNTIVASLKNIYVVALMYAAGHGIKHLTASDMRKSQKELFSSKVKRNIKDFDRTRWQEFTRNPKKFF